MQGFLEYRLLIPFAIIMAILPIHPKPHLVEKLQMLMRGTLTKPLDIFDLFFHSFPILLLIYKIVKDLTAKG